MKNTIEQVELQAAEELDTPIKKFLRNHYPIPRGRRVTVSLFDASGRKKRRSASTDNWSPESDEIRIRLEPAPTQKGEGIAAGIENVSSSTGQVASFSGDGSVQNHSTHPAETDLVKALDRAESRPGWTFVPLKKFRDEILPSEHFASMRTDVEQHHVLRLAIDKRLVLVGKVANPKAPEFPVTTIRLNRLLPEVQRMLGKPEDEDSDFQPVEIRGEPLSATIIRERRR
jgi:hypothetical protein